MLRKAIISALVLILAATVWEAAGRSSASQPVIPRSIAEGLVTEEKGELSRETFAHRGT